jgi:hypothetical protein
MSSASDLQLRDVMLENTSLQEEVEQARGMIAALTRDLTAAVDDRDTWKARAEALREETQERADTIIRLRDEVDSLRGDCERPKCLYCAFGETGDRVTFEALTAHIETECQRHPLRQMKARAERAEALADVRLNNAREAWAAANAAVDRAIACEALVGRMRGALERYKAFSNRILGTGHDVAQDAEARQGLCDLHSDAHQLLSDPTGQRAAEEWRALEACYRWMVVHAQQVHDKNVLWCAEHQAYHSTAFHDLLAAVVRSRQERWMAAHNVSVAAHNVSVVWKERAQQAEARNEQLRAALMALYTFPGVRELLAPSGSLGSIADQVEEALSDATGLDDEAPF